MVPFQKFSFFVKKKLVGRNFFSHGGDDLMMAFSNTGEQNLELRFKKFKVREIES